MDRLRPRATGRDGDGQAGAGNGTCLFSGLFAASVAGRKVDRIKAVGSEQLKADPSSGNRSENDSETK